MWCSEKFSNFLLKSDMITAFFIKCLKFLKGKCSLVHCLWNAVNFWSSEIHSAYHPLLVWYLTFSIIVFVCEITFNNAILSPTGISLLPLRKPFSVVSWQCFLHHWVHADVSFSCKSPPSTIQALKSSFFFSPALQKCFLMVTYVRS